MDEKIGVEDVMKLVEEFKAEHGLYQTYMLLKSGLEALVEDLLIAADEKAP